MRPTLRTLLLLCLISVAVPQNAYALVKGIFVGAHGGLVYLNGKHKYVAPAGAGQQNVAKIGPMFGAHAGYLHVLANGKTIVGGEGFFNMSTVNAQKNLQILDGPLEGTVSIKHKRSFGAAIMGGLLINPKS